MAYSEMTITSVSGGSITSADANLTFGGNVTVNSLNAHVARTVTLQAQINGTWTDIGTFTLPAWDPAGNGNGTATQTWTGTIPASTFMSLIASASGASATGDLSYTFRATMASSRDGATGTLTSSTSASIPTDTTADAGTAVSLSFGDALVNAAESTGTSYTVSGLDADATATVTFTSSGGGSVTANVTGNGTYSVDLSGLADGTISTTIAITDDGAPSVDGDSNTRTVAGGGTTLDKTADADVVVDLTDAGAAAGAASVAFTLTGLDAGSTATVTFSGAGGGTRTYAYTGDGARTADVSGLQGDVTATVSVADAAGNVASGAGETLAGDPVCFCAGTLVRTPAGEVAVEALRTGDLVLTHEGEARPVRWVGRQTVSTPLADPLRVLPVRIRAGALGEGLPARDLLVSPCHALLVDGVLVQAGALVNGTSVRREAAAPATFTYWHVELAGHALVLAEGVPAETFVDNVERLAFDNWAEHEALYGREAPVPEMALPRAKAARQVPAATRARLAARAEELAGRAAAAA